jgi:glycerophosphoryl diester phosphodiesterase
MFRKFIGSLFLLAALILLLTAGLALWSEQADFLNRALIILPVMVVIFIDWRVGRYLKSNRRWRFVYLLPLFFMFSISLTMVSYEFAVAYANFKLDQRQYRSELDDCFKVWSTRGLLSSSLITPNGEQNSITSIQRAFDRGAKGSEVDVFYDTEMKQYVVSHDRNPYHLKNGKILTLGELFEATGQDGYFWLDFKKLRHLKKDELAQAVRELERLTQKNNLKQRVYIEGGDPFNLLAYKNAGFKTIFDTDPPPNDSLVTPLLANLYKTVFYFGDFSVMGMNYGEIDNPIYGQRMRASLGNIPVFIYHVIDDKKLLQELSSLSPVQVLLARDQSLDLFSVSACGE